MSNHSVFKTRQNELKKVQDDSQSQCHYILASRDVNLTSVLMVLLWTIHRLQDNSYYKGLLGLSHSLGLSVACQHISPDETTQKDSATKPMTPGIKTSKMVNNYDWLAGALRQ